MTADEFDGLVKDIKAHGLLDPIILVEHEGDWVILDGRCREIACGIAGVDPEYRKIEVDDPISYFMRANIARAHYTEDQRAMARAMLTDADEDEAPYDPDQPPSPIVAARCVLLRSKLLTDAVVKGSMPLGRAYDEVVDRAWDAARIRERERAG
jgi:hypothetical protein